jgi:hypothetical protein
VTSTGVFYGRSATGMTSWYQEGDTNAGYQNSSTATYSGGEWTFHAITVTATGTNAFTFVTNTAVDTLIDQTENYGTGAADRPAAIGADGGGANRVPAGARIAMLAVWDRALTTAELTSLYGRIRESRFPMLP